MTRSEAAVGAAALAPHVWPLHRAGEALVALARDAGLVDRVASLPAPPASADEGLNAWMEGAAGSLGIEAEETEIPHGEVESSLRRLGPALVRVRLPPDGAVGLLAVASSRRGAVGLLGPDGSVRAFDSAVLRELLCSELEGPYLAMAERLLDAAGTPPHRRAHARAVLIGERLNGHPVGGMWILRPSASSSFRRQHGQARLSRLLLAFVGSTLAYNGVFVFSWWLVGFGVLEDRLDPAWVAGWALALLTMIPLRAVAVWTQGAWGIYAGALLRTRLLEGALRLTPEEIRHEGAGAFLGRTLEADAFETLTLVAGTLGLLAIVELVTAALIFGFGSGGWPLLLTLVAWTIVVALWGLQLWRRQVPWAQSRRDLTHILIERMVGHRTRLAQEQPERWHDGEDERVDAYLSTSSKMDRALTVLTGVIPRGWLVLGLIALGIPLLSQQATQAELAVALGGLLLGYRGFRRLSQGMVYIVGAATAWREVAPLFRAAARSEPEGGGSSALHVPTEGREDQPLLVVRDLVFTHAQRERPVLSDCSLTVRDGDRILLQGQSGGGKSTLASLLAGLRRPQAGLVLAGGLDLQTLGPRAWRRFVAAAPQFHENHIVTGTFAFNLLMGRSWPARNEDVAEARQICDELGLSPLLARMPAGLQQVVGETGWQLSQGEKSRVFLARALLQQAPVVILDESLASLDPETIERVLACVVRRARALMIIAHP